jgi:hypothetical protein
MISRDTNRHGQEDKVLYVSQRLGTETGDRDWRQSLGTETDLAMALWNQADGTENLKHGNADGSVRCCKRLRNDLMGYGLD